MSAPTPEVYSLAGEVLEVVLALATGLQQPARDAGDAEVSRSQLAALRVLIARGTCSMNELAAAAGVTSPTMTSTVKLLLRQGYVERRHDEHDWRSVRISLTDKGRAAQERTDQGRQRSLAMAVQSLGAEQRAMLMVALPALRALSGAVKGA